MSNEQHTPTPIAIPVKYDQDFKQLIDNNGASIVMTWGKTATPEAKALIVRAVNNHDALVADHQSDKTLIEDFLKKDFTVELARYFLKNLLVSKNSLLSQATEKQ